MKGFLRAAIIYRRERHLHEPGDWR